MAKILVLLFLGTVIFALLSFVVGAIHLARDLLVWAGYAVPLGPFKNPPPLPAGVQWTGPWFKFALWWFFVVVPLGVVLLLSINLAQRHRPPRWVNPPPMKVAAQSVAVVLTAYNDEASIGSAIDEFRRVPQVRHVFVVDNNSVDQTAAVAADHGATVVKESRQGYGYACMGGLRHALENTDDGIIVLAEGDMTFYGDDLPKLLPYLADCDMVVGTRTTRSLTRPDSQMDWFMSWGNLFLAVLIRLRYWDWTFLGRVQLTDVGCTFRAIRRDSLARLLDHLTVGTNHFSPHMILMALRERLILVEAPIRFRKRVGLSKGAGGSRAHAIRIGLDMLGSIILH